jgi:hypothetical protein
MNEKEEATLRVASSFWGFVRYCQKTSRKNCFDVATMCSPFW